MRRASGAAVFMLSALTLSLLLPAGTGTASARTASPHSSPDPITIGSTIATMDLSHFWGAAQLGPVAGDVYPSYVPSDTNLTPLTVFRFQGEVDQSNYSAGLTWTAGATGGSSGPIQINVVADWTFCEETKTACTFVAMLPGETNSTGDVRSAVQYLAAHGIQPAYFDIGNEPSGWTHFNIPWASWKTSDSSTPTSLQYALEVQRMVPVVRATFPAAKIIGLEDVQCANDSLVREVALIDGPNLSAIACHAYSANSQDVSGAKIQQFYNVLLAGNANPAVNVPKVRAGISFGCSSCFTHVFIDEMNAVSGADPADFSAYMSTYPDFVLTAGLYLRALQVNTTQALFFAFWPNTLANYALLNGSQQRPAFDWFSYFAENISDGTGVTVDSTSITPAVQPAFAQFVQNATEDSLVVVNANATTAETVSVPASMDQGAGAKLVWWNNTTARPVAASYATYLPTLTYSLAPQTVLLVDTGRPVQVTQTGGGGGGPINRPVIQPTPAANNSTACSSGPICNFHWPGVPSFSPTALYGVAAVAMILFGLVLIAVGRDSALRYVGAALLFAGLWVGVLFGGA